jgi:putative ABC transport system permease protein
MFRSLGGYPEIAVLTLLRHVSWPELRARPGRVLLFVAAIAIGVALLAAIGISNETVLAHFSTDVRRVAGHADLQVTFGTGEVGFPEAALEVVAQQPGVARALGLVHGPLAFPGDDGVVLELFGVDLLAEGVLDFYETVVAERTRDSAEILMDPTAIFVTVDIAKAHGWKLGDQITLDAPTGTQQLTIHGLVESKGLAGVFGGRVAVMDLPAAQRVLGKTADGNGVHVDQIAIALEPGSDATAVAAALRAALGSQFHVATPFQRQQDYARTFAGLRATLSGVSTLALIAAIFVVYGTTATLVTYRMPSMTTLRLLGGSARRLTQLVLVEAAILGAIGALVGVLLGSAMAFLMLEEVAVGMRLNYALPFAVAGPAFSLGHVLLLYPAIGSMAAVIAATFPARSLGRLDLLELLRPETRDKVIANVSNEAVSTIAGILVGVGCSALAWGVRTQTVVLCVAGALLPICGLVLLVLPFVRWLWPRLRSLGESLGGVAGRIAIESLDRSVDRSGVTVAAITTSITIGVAVASLTGSFRGSVRHAYFLIGDAVIMSRQTQGWVSVPVHRAIAADVAAISDVTRVDTLRIAQGQRYDGARIAVVSLTDGLFDATPAAGATFGARATAALESLKSGQGVLISENFARHFPTRTIGTSIEVPSPAGTLSLPVVGTIPDFSSDHGSVLLSDTLYRTHWGDELVNYLFVTLNDGTTDDSFQRAVAPILHATRQLRVLDVGAFTKQLDDVVARAFADMNAIQFMVIVIALAGIGDLLVSSTVDRTREFAIWRVIGAPQEAVVRAVAWEAVAIGFVAAACGTLAGFAAAWLWVRFSYPALVGYVLQFRFAWGAAMLCVGLAILCAALAGELAGRRAAGRPIHDGLRYE